MDKLNKSQVIDIINRTEIKNPETLSKINDIYNIYNYSKTQEGYKNNTKEEDVVLVQNIIQEVDENLYTIEEIKYSKSDAEHIEFFDRLGYDGMSTDILKALEKNNIPAEVLRGIKAAIGSHSYSNDELGIVIELEFESIDGSPALISMEIYKDGKRIFDYGNDKIIDRFEIEDGEGSTVIISEPKKSYREKVKSELYERLTVEAYDIDIQKAKDKRGVIYYYDRNTGHRVSKNTWEMYNI